ncbi:hypothetical protein ACFLUS_03690, partial [Chloroflexota bacterium]
MANYHWTNIPMFVHRLNMIKWICRFLFPPHSGHYQIAIIEMNSLSVKIVVRDLGKKGCYRGTRIRF